jgi:hypothetical protein
MARAKTETVPLTLGQAHSDVTRRRPDPDEPLSVQRAFHQDNKRVYEAVSETDRGHHHETLYWVEHERKIIENLTEQIRRGLADANQPKGTRLADSSPGGEQ